MKILIDTNFILSAIKKKMDFERLAEELIEDDIIEWIVPQDVLNELGNIKDRKGEKIEDKEAALLSFEILQNLKSKPNIIEMEGKNPNIDIKIINYILGTDIVLATMDKGLKSKIDNKILTLRGNNKLEII